MLMDCTDERPYKLTPRYKRLLRDSLDAALFDVETSFEELKDNGSRENTILFQLLPQAGRAVLDVEFARKFLDVGIRVIKKFNDQEPHMFETLAEELFFSFALREMEIYKRENGIKWDDHEDILDYVMEDGDHEILYSPAMDGVETLVRFGAPYLAVKYWFTPFKDMGDILKDSSTSPTA